MNKDLIILHGVKEVTLDLTAEAHLLKSAALKESQKIVAVNDSESQQVAVTTLSNLKGILKKLESSRTEIKAPVLELGKRIDSKAKEFAQELTAEESRLHNMIQAHYRAEKEKADSDRRMAEAMERKRKEKAEEEALAIEMERRRREQEANNAKTAAEYERNKAESERLATEAEKVRAAAESAPKPEVEAPAKAEKMTVRTVWKHRVLNLAALYQARPELVRMEANTNAINAAIRGGDTQIAGLEIWEEPDISVRS